MNQRLVRLQFLDYMIYYSQNPQKSCYRTVNIP